MVAEAAASMSGGIIESRAKCCIWLQVFLSLYIYMYTCDEMVKFFFFFPSPQLCDGEKFFKVQVPMASGVERWIEREMVYGVGRWSV